MSFTGPCLSLLNGRDCLRGSTVNQSVPESGAGKSAFSYGGCVGLLVADPNSLHYSDKRLDSQRVSLIALQGHFEPTWTEEELEDLWIQADV